MANKTLCIGIFLTTLISQVVQATECEPNAIGGHFCINDDGTTSNSMPNAFGGEDTYLSNGKWKSTISDESGSVYTMRSSGPTTIDPPSQESHIQDHQKLTDGVINDPDIRRKKNNDALLGRDWNSPSNVTSDGSATSSITLDDNP